jgi:hypothetical protein
MELLPPSDQLTGKAGDCTVKVTLPLRGKSFTTIEVMHPLEVEGSPPVNLRYEIYVSTEDVETALRSMFRSLADSCTKALKDL